MTVPDPIARMKREPLPAADLGKVEGLMGVLCSLRTTDLFGHLFELRPAFLSGIRNVESTCLEILETNLRADLSGATRDTWAFELATSQLEENLGQLLGAQSPFWEQYYARLLRASSDNVPAGGITKWTPAAIQQAARIRYPHFYIPLEAMIHGSGPQGLRDTLLPLSVQHFLEGSLLSIHDRTWAGEAFQQANRLLGPIAAPEYRRLLARKMEECR